MPASHKKKICLHDDCGFLKKYTQLLNWLRTLGSMNGSRFEDIGNLNCLEGYPLMEVEVVAPTEKSAKFLIYRDNLYVIAFTARNRWLQYACEFTIEGFEMLDYDGSYVTGPCKQVGPKVMIDVVDCLSTPTKDYKFYVQSCAVFQVHLSEAARLYPIESLVCKSLSPTNGGNNIRFKRPYQDEELCLPSGNISDESDVFSLVREGQVDYNLASELPSYVVDLIRKYSLLSKIWFVYSLTGKRIFPVQTKHISRFHLKSKKSLRCTLAVLCNTNLEKVLAEWQKKSSTLPSGVFDEMKRKVRELQAEKKVLSAKNQG